MTTKQVKQSFQTAYYTCSPNSEVRFENLGKFVLDIDREMTKFGFAIKKVVSEQDNGQFYALVNLDENSITKALKCYPEPELEFFYSILDKIVKSGDFTCTHTQALNMTNLMKSNLAKYDATICIDNLLEEKWLENDAG